MMSRAYSRAMYGSGWVVLTVLLVLLALAAAVVTYALFLAPKQKQQLNGFAKWLYGFLNFNEMVMPIVVKIAYIFTAVLLTLFSLIQILSTANVLGGFLTLVLGNVGARIAFELLILLFSIHEKLCSIDRKTKNENPQPTPPRPTFVKTAPPQETIVPPVPSVQPETPKTPETDEAAE